MKDTQFVALDVHTETISVATAKAARAPYTTNSRMAGAGEAWAASICILSAASPARATPLPVWQKLTRSLRAMSGAWPRRIREGYARTEPVFGG